MFFFASWNRVERPNRVERTAYVLPIRAALLPLVSIVQDLRVVLDVFPLFLVVVLVVSVLELGFALSQLLFLFRGFVELVPGVVDQRKLPLVFLFVLVLQVLQNRIDVVASAFHVRS